MAADSNNVSSMGTDRRGRVPVATEKVSQVVARRLVSEIAERRLAPNTMLEPEATMAEYFGVGRSSIREALRILEDQGILLMRRGAGGGPLYAGASVTSFARTLSLFMHLSRMTYGDLLQTRMTIEPIAARLAAENQDDQALDVLQTYIDGQPAQADTERVSDRDFALHASEFHHLVNDSGNTMLDFIARALVEILDHRIGSLMVYDAKTREAVHTAHRQIVTAITDSEAERAERLTRLHLEAYEQVLVERIPGFRKEIVECY